MITVLGIISIVVGFLFMMGSYLSVMKKKPVWLAVVLFIAAILTLTIFPVTLAVFYAA